MIDLEKANDEISTDNNSLPDEMMSEEFLDSPVGRIMQALAGLEVAATAFDSRIAQCEKYIMYLLAKDPHMAPRIAAIAQATKNEEKQETKSEDVLKSEALNTEVSGEVCGNNNLTEV